VNTYYVTRTDHKGWVAHGETVEAESPISAALRLSYGEPIREYEHPTGKFACQGTITGAIISVGLAPEEGR
jgi:hypothetical protein